MKLIAFFCLSILLHNYSYAQYDDIVFEHLTIEDGLSQSSVKSIYQDSKGFMWFGTNDGLNRYDGYNFKIFKNDIYDSASISNNEIYYISEDADGFLWIATAGGLNRYNRLTESFVRYSISDKMKDHSLSDAIISVLGYNNRNEKFIWLTTSDGIYRFDVKNNKFRSYMNEKDESDNNKVISLCRDSNNELWAGFYMEGIFKYNKRNDKFEKVFKGLHDKNLDLYVTRPYEDSEGVIWFGSLGSLNKYYPKSGKIISYKEVFEKAAGIKLETGFINNIVEDKNGDNLIISSTGHGLIIFNKKNESAKIHTHDPYDKKSLSLNVALSIYKDKSGIIWIGTNGSGIDRLNPHLNKFKVVTKTVGGISSSSIRTFFEDYFGTLWISGYRGLDRLYPDTGKIRRYGSPSNHDIPSHINNIVYSIAEDKDEPSKYIYFGTEGSGLVKFDFKSETFKRIYPPFFDPSYPRFNIINCLYDDGKGNLWIGTGQSLLKMIKATMTFVEYSHNPDDPESIGSQDITAICEDSFGNLWIGTNLGGLNLMDRKRERFTSFRLDLNDSNSINSNFIKCIFEDKDKTLWIGTAGGLNKFDRSTKTFKRYTTQNGLPNNVIYGILEDNQANLWLSTNLGLSKFNPDMETFVNYDVKDGLQSNEFNTNAYFKTKNGELFFGGINGYNSFLPKNIKKNNYIPPVVLTDLQLFNKSLVAGENFDGKIIIKNSIIETKTIELSYLDNVVTIEFAALDFASPNKNLYSYKLEGFDNHWSTPRQKRTVSYTNLNPGEYIFRVTGSNNDGVWNTQGATLKIIIHPPFWLTWWFFILSAIIAGISIYGFYLHRVRTIKKANRKLEQLVLDRTAELNNANISLRNEVKERKHAEEELRLLNIQKDKFFSIIAHDLKSPFYGLLGYSELLSHEYNNLTEDEKVNFIKDIQSISKNTYRFLENLLEWARIQTGKIDLVPEQIYLHEEVFNIFNVHYGLALQKKITLTNNVEQNILVFADRNMLNLILRNLISNALKFTNNNGLIKVYAKDEGNYVETIVIDNGIGISPENIEKLFRIDMQYSSKGTGEEEGTGLGLLLCKEMIEMNKGSIRVESELGKGTSFIFSLPKNI